MNPSNSLNTKNRIDSLESKLKETVELLHVWKGEAFSYRSLAFAILDGKIDLEDARLMLKSAEPNQLDEGAIGRNGKGPFYFFRGRLPAM